MALNVIYNVVSWRLLQVPGQPEPHSAPLHPIPFTWPVVGCQFAPQLPLRLNLVTVLTTEYN